MAKKRSGRTGGGRSGKATTSRRGATRKAKAASGKVGSDARAARKVGGKLDFGVPETGSERNRRYVSEEIKANDPGSAPEPSSGTAGVGQRVSGAGGNASGVGSSSGGDVDTDIIGIGQGGTTVSQAGPDDRTDGPDMIGGDQSASEAFAAKPPPGARNAKRDSSRKGRPGARGKAVRGSTVDHSGGDVSTTGAGAGSGAVTNPQAPRDDDSFAGEINLSEAGGIDNTRADRQGS